MPDPTQNQNPSTPIPAASTPIQPTDIPPMPDSSETPPQPIVEPAGSAAPSNDIAQPMTQATSDFSQTSGIPDIPPVVSPPSKRKFPGGKIIPTILGILILVGAVGAGVVLVQQQQDIQEKAETLAPCESTPGQTCKGMCKIGEVIGKGICSGSEKCCAPASTPECTTNQDCSPGKICKSSSCVTPQCITNQDCPSGQTCQNNSCVTTSQCTTNQDCSLGKICKNSSCITPQCTTNQDCQPGQVCQNNSCVAAPECTTNQDCKSNQKCENNKCIDVPECTTNQDCQPGQTCSSGKCTTSGGGGGTGGGGGGAKSCPDGSANATWCATFNCPNGDTDGDGTCNPTAHGQYAGDQGATYSVQSGSSCSAPSNCGQVDYYKGGTSGSSWDQFCGFDKLKLTDCGGGTGGGGGGGGGGSEVTGQCNNVKAYDTEWNTLSTTQLSALKSGDKVRFTVGPTASGGSFDKAKFTINTTDSGEVTTKKPGTDEFYFEYTIPDGVTGFTIKANVHHSSLGWF